MFLPKTSYQMAYFQSIATAAGKWLSFGAHSSTYGPSFGHRSKFIYGTTCLAGDGTALPNPCGHRTITRKVKKFTVNTYIYPQTNTTSSTCTSSSTEHFDPARFANSAPIDARRARSDSPITVDGYIAARNVGLNGTWPITSIAASGLTVNVQATIGLGALTLSGRRSRRGQSLRPRHGSGRGPPAPWLTSSGPTLFGLAI